MISGAGGGREKRKVTTEHKMCGSIFSTSFVETIFILRRNEQDKIKNDYWTSCKVSIILVLL